MGAFDEYLAEHAPTSAAPAPTAAPAAGAFDKYLAEHTPTTAPLGAFDQYLTDAQKAFMPWHEVKAGAESAWKNLLTLPDKVKTQFDSNAFGSAMHQQGVMDKIDAGKIKSADQLRGELLPSNPTAAYGPPTDDVSTRMEESYRAAYLQDYLRAAPAERQKKRAIFDADKAKLLAEVDAGITAFNQHLKDTAHLKAKTADFTDVRTPADFGNWLAYSASSSAVQLLPVMAAARFGGASSAAALGTTMALQETISNRLQYATKDAAKQFPDNPDKQAEAIAAHLHKTKDITTMVAIVSGALDLAGPVRTVLKDLLKKELQAEAAKYGVKQVGKDILEEGVTGAGQEMAQITGKYAGEERAGVPVFSRENVYDIINAATGEAAGGGTGAAVNYAVSKAGEYVEKRKQASAERQAVEEKAREARVYGAETAEKEFGALVAQYKNDGMSDLDAIKAAGRDMVSRGITPPSTAFTNAGGTAATVQPAAGEGGDATASTTPTTPTVSPDGTSGADVDGTGARVSDADKALARTQELAELEALTQAYVDPEDVDYVQELVQEALDKGFTLRDAYALAFAEVEVGFDINEMLQAYRDERDAVAPTVDTVSPVPEAGKTPVVTEQKTQEEVQQEQQAQDEAAALAQSQIADKQAQAQAQFDEQQSAAQQAQAQFDEQQAQAQARFDEQQGKETQQPTDQQPTDQQPTDQQAQEDQRYADIAAAKQKADDARQALWAAEAKLQEVKKEFNSQPHRSDELYGPLESARRAVEAANTAEKRAWDAYEKVAYAPAQAQQTQQPTDQQAQEDQQTPQATDQQGPPKPKHAGGRPPSVTANMTEEQLFEYNQRRRDEQTLKSTANRLEKQAQKDFDTEFDSDQYTTDDAETAARTEHEANRIAALTDIYRINNDPNLRGTAVGKRAKAIVSDNTRFTRREHEIAQNKAKADPEIMARRARAKKAAKQAADKASKVKKDGFSLAKMEGIAGDDYDASFESFDGAPFSQLLSFIAHTGNTAFERALASVLAPLCKNMRVKIVHSPSDIPVKAHRKSFKNAAGMFAPRGKDGGTCYLDGTPGGWGLTPRVVLHEALHGATLSRIQAWMDNPNSVDPATRAACEELQRVMEDAWKVLASQFFSKAFGKKHPEAWMLANKVMNAHLAGEMFANVKEFVTYGITHPDVQLFLLKTAGTRTAKNAKPTKLFTRFVTSVRNILGLSDTHQSAFQDLLLATHDLMASPLAAPAKKNATPSQAKRTAITQLEDKLRKSRTFTELNTAIWQLASKVRSGKDAVRLLRATWNAIDVGKLDAILPTLSTADITRWAGDKIRNLQVVNDAVEEMAGMRNKMVREIAEFIPVWEKFNAKFKAGGELLADVLHTTTLVNVNPAKHPDAATYMQHDAELIALNNKLKDPATTGKERVYTKGQITKRTNAINHAYTIWDKLGKYSNGLGQRIYKDVIAAYDKTFTTHEQILLDKIASSNTPGDVNDASTPKGKLMAAIVSNFQAARALDVYSPLMRYGPFWFRIGKGKGSEFYMFESAAARNNAVEIRLEELAKAGDTRTREEMLGQGYLDEGDNPNELRKSIVDASDMLKNLFAMLDQNKTADIETIKDNIYQMYLMTLPERDIRRKFTHRKGRTGFSSDAIRNFVSSQHTSANQLTRLAYSDKVRNALGQAYAELAGNPDKLRLTRFVDEIAARAVSELTPTPANEFGFDKAARATNQAVFLYMLTSIKSALVQFTQVVVVGIPTLVAEFGSAKTLAIMGQYSWLFNKLGTTKKDANGNVITEWGQPTIRDSSYVKNHKYSALLTKAWNAAQDKDIFMATYAGDLTGRSQVPSIQHRSLPNKAVRGTYSLMTGAFHHTERLGRELMYMTAFELEMNRLVAGGLSADAAYDGAVKKATDVVKNTMFDFTQYNKPRLMKHWAGRIATQFLFFPLQMTSYLVRNFYGMLPFFNKADKREAATKFFGTLGMVGLFAGATGMPLYSVIMGAAEGVREAMRGEDDDEYYDEDDNGNPLGKRNLDFWFRNWFLENYFGEDSSLAKYLGLTPEQADLIQRSAEMGVIPTLTDMNIGTSVSLNNLWTWDKPPAETTKEAVTDALFSTFGGPTGGMIQNLASGIDDLGKGDYLRAAEKFTPAFFRGAVTAVRLHEEGARTRRGDQIVDPEFYTTAKLAAQAAGAGSTTVAELQKANIQYKRMAEDIKSERQQVLDSLYRALRKDEEKLTPATEAVVTKAMDAIEDFNNRNGFGPYVITGDTISESMGNKAKGYAISEELGGLPLSEEEAAMAAEALPRSRDRVRGK